AEAGGGGGGGGARGAAGAPAQRRSNRPPQAIAQAEPAGERQGNEHAAQIVIARRRETGAEADQGDDGAGVERPGVAIIRREDVAQVPERPLGRRQSGEPGIGKGMAEEPGTGAAVAHDGADRRAPAGKAGPAPRANRRRETGAPRRRSRS